MVKCGIEKITTNEFEDQIANKALTLASSTPD
jgi:hypothetical protein